MTFAAGLLLAVVAVDLVIKVGTYGSKFYFTRFQRTIAANE